MEIIISIVSFLFLCFSACSCVSVTVLKPKTNGSEAALIITPGDQIPVLSYLQLVDVIQSRSSFKLWVALLDNFHGILPKELQLSMGFNEAVQSLMDAGYKGNKVFLAGHDLGGTLVGQYGNLTNKRLEGVLLYGAVLQTGISLKMYPVPVLTLNGDLDGVSRITVVVDTFERLQGDEKYEPEQKYRTPVIVMQGVNHAQFVSGIVPPSIAQHDLSPEVSDALACQIIADYTDVFLVWVRNDTTTNVTGARKVLDQEYMTSSQIFQPLSVVKALDQNKEQVSHWTITAQQLVVSLKNTSLAKFVNEEEYKNSNTLRNTYLSTKNITITSHTQVEMPKHPDEIGTPVSPIQLKSKMQSQKAIKLRLPDQEFGNSSSCQEINEEAFILAFSKASSIAKARYTSRGKPIFFMTDKFIFTSELEWRLANLHYNQTKTGLYVQAFRFNTDQTRMLNAENDCTLLSPFRAMEWIYIDSLIQDIS